MANVVVSALATWNGKALKKGKQDISSFDKSVKALGRTFGVTFSAAALINFSKKAVNAFAADEKAAKDAANTKPASSPAAASTTPEKPKPAPVSSGF